MISPGELDQRIILQRETLTPDGAGGATSSWSNYAKVWAKIRKKSAQEVKRAEAVNSELKLTVIIRNKSGILAEDRIVWGSKVLNVIAPLYVNSRDMYLFIECELGRPS